MSGKRMIEIIITIIAIIVIFTSFCEARGGIYFYRNKGTGKVAYVGRTNNFARRHREHVNNGRIFASRNYRMDKYYTNTGLKRKERYYINKYDPPHNIA